MDPKPKHHQEDDDDDDNDNITSSPSSPSPNRPKGEGGGGGALSIEKIFEEKEVPPWQDQLTFRAFAVSLILGILFSFIVMKLNLTTGIIPSLNVSAGLLGFFFVKTWTKFLQKSGCLKQPFTRQENTVIQTCVVASSGIAFSARTKYRLYTARCLCVAHVSQFVTKTYSRYENVYSAD